jgi:gluconate 2-dehydrogenase gamma chain
MDRREALRLLATGSALQLAPRNLLAALREARTLLGTQTALRTLDSHQNATVTAIAELIIPRTETPGATDVGVSQFIDLILTEWYIEDERDRFLNGLADVDARTQSLFRRNFVDSSPDQQAEILTALGEQMTEEKDAVRDRARRYRGSLPEPEKNFYYMVRSVTLTGYYTSEDGATRELGFQIIPDHHDGCANAGTAKEGPENQ